MGPLSVPPAFKNNLPSPLGLPTVRELQIILHTMYITQIVSCVLTAECSTGGPFVVAFSQHTEKQHHSLYTTTTNNNNKWKKENKKEKVTAKKPIHQPLLYRLRNTSLSQRQPHLTQLNIQKLSGTHQATRQTLLPPNRGVQNTTGWVNGYAFAVHQRRERNGEAGLGRRKNAQQDTTKQITLPPRMTSLVPPCCKPR